MLEDFFTLTEMKDGISTVARIGELIYEIQKLQNAVEINTADMIRQCSTAANTLASTKDAECLQHFVQLNGVHFLNHWLQDAQNCGEGVSNPAEDLIVAVLTALECLPIDNEQSTSCGVISTVHRLLSHRNVLISQKARSLYQKWSSVPKYGTNGEYLYTEEACQTDHLKSPEASHKKEFDKQIVANEVVNPVEESKLEVTTFSDAPLSDPFLTNYSTDSAKQPSVLKSPNSSNGNATLGDIKNLVSSPAYYVGSENGQSINKEDKIVSNISSIKESDTFESDRLHLEKDTAETLNHLAVVTGNLQDSTEYSTDKEEGPTSSSSTDDMSMCNELALERCMKNFGDSSKKKETKSTRLTDYDDTDALEVARLVAIEVEREVIDYRGHFCGSPDINSRNTDSPDLEARRQPEPVVDELNDNRSSSTGADSGTSSSLKEDGSGITDGSGPLSRKHTRIVQLGNLDLNENQCDEETDCNPKSMYCSSVNLSMPIAVAASRGSSVFPARLHFEGELGWKGSAATSAFRPASPRRTPEVEKSLSASSHKTSNVLFDLNVADSDSATSGEPLSTAILPASSDLAPKGSSTSVGVSGGFKLDLNCLCGDEEDAVIAINVPPLWNHQQFNGSWSQPSSSSSSRQPAIRNFDLNDNMSIIDGSARGIDGSSVKISARDTPDLSAVTIMGKRIIVGQKEHGHQYQHNFLGPSAESRFPTRSIQPYAHTPDYSVVSYPSQPATSFPPAFFAAGGVPYMVDARGAPVIPPPMAGLTLGISHPSFSTRATPPSSNDLSYSYLHPSMDFNYGVSSEGTRRETGNYWPVSYQGQTVFVGERTRNMSQGGSSGLVVKRKEPESGWDMYSRR